MGFFDGVSTLSKPSDLTKALYVATAGMNVQNQRILVISQNLANASVRPHDPKGSPYQRKTISFEADLNKSLGTEVVRVKGIQRDKSPFPLAYSPGDPAANPQGFVLESNVKPMVELSDMREASRSHEANLRVFERVLSMLQNTISLLKN